MTARLRSLLIILALAANAIQARAASPGYKFTIVAQTGDTIAGKTITGLGSALINNHGDIVFSANFDGGSGLFTPSSVLVQTGDIISGRALSSIGYFRFNDAGTLVFLGSFPGGSGLFTPSEVLVQTGDSIARKELLGFTQSPIFQNRPFAINNVGDLVFTASFLPGLQFSTGEGVFTRSELLAQTFDYGTPFGGVYRMYSPSINDTGAVVFGGADSFISEFNIYTPSGLLASGDPDTGFDSPVINNSGSVVFFGLGGAGNTLLGTPSQTLLRVPAPFSFNTPPQIGGQPLCELIPVPLMNNPGTVLFSAHFPPTFPAACSMTGLFTLSELLLESGDSIDGKTIDASPVPQSPYPLSLNDSGIILLRANFTDGASALVMATPINSGVEGDVNGDGVVNCSDLEILVASLGKGYGQPGFNPRADLNHDGIIDLRDLAGTAQKLPANTSCP